LARIGALGRRSSNDNPQGELLEFGDLSINVGQIEVRVDGVPVELTDREFKLAVMLFSNVGRLISRDHLLENIWGITANIATRTVDTHVSRLRQKLHLTPEHGWQLKAIYQHGYRLEQLADSQVA
ncbi:MAG: response regulator transcription factor, partial [Sedimenticola sp.]|nr:response regulator transcription factor [Sedimenticola sp.]